MLSFVIQLAGVTVWWPGLVLLGLFIGFLTGMFGVGGGFLLTPLLNIVFGISYPIAVGSGLAQIFLTGAVSTWKHWKKGNVDSFLGVIMAAGALLGTELGVRLLKKLSLGGKVVLNNHSFASQDLILNFLFVILMCGVAIHILKESSSAGNKGTEEADPAIARRIKQIALAPQLSFTKSGITALSLWIPLGLSFLVGILTGMMGVGGGFIAFPLLVYVLGVPTVIAVGTSAFQILFSSGYGALRHAGQGHVNLLIVGLLLVGSLLGVQLGVYATKFFGGVKIRRYFAFVLGLGILVILWDLVGKIFL